VKQLTILTMQEQQSTNEEQKGLNKSQVLNALDAIKKEISSIYGIPSHPRITFSSETYDHNKNYMLEHADISIEKHGIYVMYYKPKHNVKVFDLGNDLTLKILGYESGVNLYSLFGKEKEPEHYYILENNHLNKLIKQKFNKRKYDITRKKLSNSDALRVNQLRRFWTIYLSFKVNKFTANKPDFEKDKMAYDKWLMFQWLPYPVKDIKRAIALFKEAMKGGGDESKSPKDNFIQFLEDQNMFININK